MTQDAINPAPGGSSPVTVLAQGIGASHTGDTNETILATIPVSAGVMGANGLIVVRYQWTKTGTAGTSGSSIRFGLSGAGLSGTALYTAGGGAASNIVGTWLPTITNVGATNSQIGPTNTNAGGLGQTANALLTAAIDTTQATEIVITCTLGNAADTMNLAFFQALLYPHA